MISLIAAVSKNNVIGNENNLPWYIPEDLKYFKAMTTDRVVVMGRKTFESIGKPLPDRINIVLTRDIKYEAEGCIVYNSPSQVLSDVSVDDEIFIIGGSKIYHQFIDFADKLYITQIHHYFKGDIFFPKIDNQQWELMSSQNGADSKYNYSFNIYKRL